MSKQHVDSTLLARSHTPQKAYTLAGSREAEARVTQDLALLTTALDAQLAGEQCALLLIGTYARGEGSVVNRDDEMHACSPYELVVVLRKHTTQETSILTRLEATWTEELGVDVRLHPITPTGLGRLPVSLTWIDAYAGDIELLAGDAHVLEQVRPQLTTDLSAEGVAELLCDAALSLSFTAGNEQEQPLEVADIHHAVLLTADAALLHISRYETDTRSRRAELPHVEHELAMPGLCAAHTDALYYQARPDAWHLSDSFASFAEFRRSRITLMRQLHLAIEGQRLKTSFDPLGYALHDQRIWPDTESGRWNALQKMLRAARAGEVAACDARCDAHERLARCAVLLAYANDRPEARRLAARLLGVANDDAHTPDDHELDAPLLALASSTLRTHDPLTRLRYG